MGCRDARQRAKTDLLRPSRCEDKLTVKRWLPENFYAALQAAGMPQVPGEFSVVPRHQVIPSSVLAEISDFIRAFDRVTTRDAWRAAALREAPPIAQLGRSEVCFFSAWDFHLPVGGGWQLIEFNDNGSGLLFAAIINALYYEAAGLGPEEGIAAPVGLPAFNQQIGDFVEREARVFFGERPSDLLLVLDDAESLQRGRFRGELRLLCDLLRQRGWRAELGDPTGISWDGRRLLFKGQAVGFIVNRSTDFFWGSETFSALRMAYQSGRVYVAPNPFTYATRSDKRLLEWLSLPERDKELEIGPEERQILGHHVPETHVVRAENLEQLAQRKREFVFKPLHGFAGRGLFGSEAVGRRRLHRLMTHSDGYVAQRWVPKPSLAIDGRCLWADLRVWAYRGKIFHLSGRASGRPDRLELASPGGWLPTYAALKTHQATAHHFARLWGR